MFQLGGSSVRVAASKVARVAEVVLVGVAGQLLLSCLRSYGMIQ